MAGKKRKRCSNEGCRKLADVGEDLCQSCKDAKVVEEKGNGSGGNGVSEEPSEVTLKLTDAELDKFNALRMKMEMTLQSIRVLQLEQEAAARAYRDQQHQRETLIAQKQAEVNPLNDRYLDFVRKLAKKYGVAPKYMGIDDETGQINDLTPPQAEAEPG